MATSTRRFFVPQEYEDEEKTRVARLLTVVLLALVVSAFVITMAAAVYYAVAPDSESQFTLLSGAVMTLVFAGLLLLVRVGLVRQVSVAFLTLLWLLITVWIFTSSGISSDSSTLVYALIVVLAGLLLGGRAAVLFTLVSSLAAVGAYYVEANGLLVVVDRPTSLADAIFVAVPLVLTGVLLRYAVRGMSDALERARTNEQAQLEANRELERLRASLEERVVDRTRELETRSRQWQAATEISQLTTSILDAEQMLWQVAELVQERFDLYHVGVMLLDPSGEWAVYRAGSGQSGRRLGDEGFRLEVGGDSMVGWCTAHREARIAQDVSTAPIHARHDLVPNTRSEAALPIIVRGRVLGALSAQSEHTDTFDPSTVAVLQTVADQLAVALDNARLFEESQRALDATRRAYDQLSREAWAEFLSSRARLGYSLLRESVVPVSGAWQPEMIEAVRKGQAVVRDSGPGEVSEGDGAGAALALPLKVRDDVIGALSLHKHPDEEAWTAAEVELVQRLVDQVGTALESARLFQETQRRAAREQAIRRITEQMRRSVDVEAILQSTVAEVARALGVPRAYVRLGTEAELPGTAAKDVASESIPAGD
ncbi:MAG: GAF domain-containing protein [Anaerolineae bacterium]